MTPIKIISVIEATTVTGPAKNLLNFCRLARSPWPGLPPVEVSVVVFHRSGSDLNGNGSRHRDGHERPNAFVEAARKDGIEVDVIHERFRFDPRVLGKLLDVVERRAPDIIQTHGVKSHFLLRLSGLSRHYHWIAFHHGYTTTDLKMVLYNQLNRWSLPSAHRVITVCQAFARQLESEGVSREKISVLHNSINANGFSNRESDLRTLKEHLGIESNESVVLAVGRLSREKGHTDLIAALGILRRRDSSLNFKLVIVGDGPERQNIRAAGEAEGLAERIVFAGHVGDASPFYALADALALPSHSEGSPNVLLEAMIAELPVVATAVGGVPEIAVAEESALLVPAHDPQLFADALHRILTNPDLAQMLRQNAKARIMTNFSPESYGHSLTGIYQSLLCASTESAEPAMASA